jgi:hypothetical protein
MEEGSRGARLRALDRLLEYARAEGEELGLEHLEQPLNAAILALKKALDNVIILSRRTPRDRCGANR